MNRIAIALFVGAVVLLSGCANTRTFDASTHTVFPLNRAWVNARQVEYVTTDISDSAMAGMAGVNYAPRLRDALGAKPSVLERVYKFAGGEQISIFQSAPQPAGPASTDLAYSPLWRLALVRWSKPALVRELRSEEELLAAEEKGELSIELTNVVVNCPITRDVPPAR